MKSLFELGFVISLVDQATSVLHKVDAGFGHLNETVGRTRNWREAGENLAYIGAGALAVGAASALALKSMVEPAIAMQGELAHVRTAMDDGIDTAANLAEVQRVANQVAGEGVLTNVELAQAYYLARSNAMDHVHALEAVRAATKLVEATTKDATEAQQALPETIRTLTTMVHNFGGTAESWADSFAKLQTKYAFKNITELTDGLKYAMPIMKTAGIEANDAFAALAGLQVSGMHGRMAGTTFREFVSKLAVGKELHEYAVQNERGGLDIAATMERLHSRLGGLPPLEIQRTLKGLGFGLRDVTGVSLLIDKGAELASIMRDMEHSQGAAAARSAERMAAVDAQFAVLGNNVELLREAFGEALLPTLNSVVPALTHIVQGLREVSEAHPHLVTLAVGALALSAAILIPLGTIGIFLGGLASVVSYAPAVGVALGWVSGGFSALVAPVWAATGAIATFLLTNPVGWAILAVGAIGLVYHHWDLIKSGAALAWDGVKAAFTGGLTWLESHWLDLAAPILLGPFGLIVPAIHVFLPELYQAGIDLMKSIGRGMLDAIEWPLKAAASVAQKIKDFFVGHSPPPVGPLHELSRVHLIETVAEHMEPHPVIAAARRAAAAVALTLPLSIAPVMAMPTSPVIAPATAAAPQSPTPAVEIVAPEISAPAPVVPGSPWALPPILERDTRLVSHPAVPPSATVATAAPEITVAAPVPPAIPATAPVLPPLVTVASPLPAAASPIVVQPARLPPPLPAAPPVVAVAVAPEISARPSAAWQSPETPVLRLAAARPVAAEPPLPPSVTIESTAPAPPIIVGDRVPSTVTVAVPHDAPPPAPLAIPAAPRISAPVPPAAVVIADRAAPAVATQFVAADNRAPAAPVPPREAAPIVIAVPAPDRTPRSIVHLTYAPVIHAAPDRETEMRALLEDHADDLMDRLARAQERAERTAY